MLEHQGIRWGYVFLRGASHISEEEMRDLMAEAVEMYLRDEAERKVRRSDFEGVLRTDRSYELLGQFGGQRFDLELETAYGRDRASFLINKQTKAPGPAFSRN